MAAYTAGFMTHFTCRLTAKNRDQLQNPTFGNRAWTVFTFFLLVAGFTAYNSATVPFLLRNPSRKSFRVNRLVSSAYCSYVLRVSNTQKRNVILGKVLACNDATVREAIFICSAVNRTDEANGFGFL